MLATLAPHLSELDNPIALEGHTDRRVYPHGAGYTNWELSSDRANAARRLMEKSGLRPGQVVQVRGFADHSLREPADPNAAANRRVSVIVKYQNAPPPEEPAPAAHEEAAPAAHEKAAPKPAEHH